VKTCIELVEISVQSVKSVAFSSLSILNYSLSIHKMSAISKTNFQFPKQTGVYNGKVRDVYSINDELVVIVASDRVSAFDHILSAPIPFKGQVLNQTAAHFFQAVDSLAPTHVLAVPDANVTIGLKCAAYPVEMVVRGYLAGHSWRVYNSGLREICGVKLPDGLKENDKLPEPIITPTTKSHIGHDEDISEKEIMKSGLVKADEYMEMKHYTLELFKKGTEMAASQGLILVDTKYEFGYLNGRVFVIDEIHTPDSSRYFYAEGYAERQVKGEAQRQLSKEFLRKWLIEKGFQGLDGQIMPDLTPEIIQESSERYIELYEKVTGDKFIRADISNIEQRIMDNTLPVLNEILKNI
jgi:phosphoribosylaminoimidazole-succinocarboxamide synthase